MGLALSRRLVVGLDQRLAGAGQQGDVAAVAHLQDLAGDLHLLAGEHLRRILRVLEPLEAPFAQRIDADDLGPPVHRLLQLVEDPRGGGARVVPDVDDQVGLLEVVERGGPDRDADAFRERHRGALVAHVGAVGQVVGAVHPRQQLEHVAGLEAGPPAGVEHRRIRGGGLGAQLAPDLGESLLPRDRQVSIRSRVPPEGMGQAARGFQVMVGPGVQLGQGVLFEEGLVRPVPGDLPRGGLDPVLADLERMRRRRLAPRATDAHEAVRLVLVDDDLGPLDGDAFADQDVSDRHDRSVAARGPLVGLDLRMLLRTGHASPQTTLAVGRMDLKAPPFPSWRGSSEGVRQQRSKRIK